jgi:hypothetical protein
MYRGMFALPASLDTRVAVRLFPEVLVSDRALVIRSCDPRRYHLRAIEPFGGSHTGVASWLGLIARF